MNPGLGDSQGRLPLEIRGPAPARRALRSPPTRHPCSPAIPPHRGPASPGGRPPAIPHPEPLLPDSPGPPHVQLHDLAAAGRRRGEAAAVPSRHVRRLRRHSPPSLPGRGRRASGGSPRRRQRRRQRRRRRRRRLQGQQGCGRRGAGGTRSLPHVLGDRAGLAGVRLFPSAPAARESGRASTSRGLQAAQPRPAVSSPLPPSQPLRPQRRLEEGSPRGTKYRSVLPFARHGHRA